MTTSGIAIPERHIRRTPDDTPRPPVCPQKKGITQKSLAQKIGVSDISVSDVINDHRVSDRIMRAIAEAIGSDVRLVFPKYYLRTPKRKTSKSAIT
ncbi:MAG: helix-turn-helix transcriptional regulator [Syntrophales bacterium]|jgi:transcriptional regulator with XRE-family HTH domain|nr:helix-turn-helix transcriptional regulator [Syntrophales bacterium]